MRNIIIITVLTIIFSFLSSVSASENVEIHSPSMSYDKVIIEAENILTKENIDIKSCCILLDIHFDYLNDEWIVYFENKSGALGSRLHIRMNDKDLSKYFIGRGA